MNTNHRATIVIPAFGSSHWKSTGDRAAERVVNQQAEILIINDAESVPEALNIGASRTKTEWLVCMGADDSMAPGCVQAMLSLGTKDIRSPSIQYTDVEWNPLKPARCIPETNIEYLNFIPGPSLIPTAMAREIGWKNYPMWEDWAFFLTALRRGATYECIPDAVYLYAQCLGTRNTQRKIFQDELWQRIRSESH